MASVEQATPGKECVHAVPEYPGPAALPALLLPATLGCMQSAFAFSALTITLCRAFEVSWLETALLEDRMLLMLLFPAINLVIHFFIQLPSQDPRIER